MTADIVITALAAKHAQDVFVVECKNGPTQQGSHRRMDAWVMLKTWSPVTMIGYEVKVSRSDWRRDDKLGEYAGLCHMLNVVAPKGIVPIAELPDGVGLIEMVGDTHRLVTRRKATRREIELPASLLVYVLMCRSDIKSERPDTTFERKAHLRDEIQRWASSKEERRNMSYAVSQKIREQFDLQETELRRLQDRAEQLERIEKRIVELGFNPADNVNSWQVEERIKQISAIITPGTLRLIDECTNRLTSVSKHLASIGAPVVPNSEVA